MSVEVVDKITAGHLARSAYLYVRQSTLRQVMENTTSTERQYGLRSRAVGLGWPPDQVVVIDEDLGRSGATAEGREGFARLVADVGMGKAGIVIGLEVSRLARNNADWHRLLEICALTETLILDEDGLYDPCSFNDRMLLGMKGQLSEAELHLLRARLRGGVLSKARSGELEVPLPIGLVYDPAGKVVLDPDQGVRGALTRLFATFVRTGSALATVKAFDAEGLSFPLRPRNGPAKGELIWAPLRHHRVLQVLHNPRYAGAFCFGRHKSRKGPDGKQHCSIQPREQWISFIPDAHPGYISWADFEANQSRLAELSTSRGTDRRASPPREGTALLQGMVVCGRCGGRMTVRYHTGAGHALPTYLCQRAGIETATAICESLPGAGIDAAVSALLVSEMTPMALEVALSVQDELESRAAEANTLRRSQVERARHAAEAARLRYLSVDPDNRLVAASLEADWNDALRELSRAGEDYERQNANAGALSDEARAAIAALASDFPALWTDARTPDRERKRMVRLLVDDVTLARADSTIAVHVRFKGGQATTLSLPAPLPAGLARKTPDAVVAEVDRLLEYHTDAGVAVALNNAGVVSGTGQPFHKGIVLHIRITYGLGSHAERLQQRGLVGLAEAAATMGVSTSTVKNWHHEGRIVGERSNDKGECLYQVPECRPYKKLGRPPGPGRSATKEAK
ncbi:MAG: recombinase family protein [Acidimicrobiales bacterium]